MTINSDKFKQQALPAWQPILTARTVLPPYFIIGIFFVPIGAFLIHTNSLVKDVEIDYTDCVKGNNKYPITSGKSMNICAKGSNSTEKITCNIEIPVDKFGETDWKANVFLYYGLENFYQNHRRYVKSKDVKQLLGDIKKEPEDVCEPFSKTPDNKTIVPCGAIANSMFSDVIKIQYKEKDNVDEAFEGSGENQNAWKYVPLISTGIAWDSDKKYKYKNPDITEGMNNLEEVFKNANVGRPPDWSKNIWELPNQLQNEDLIVWMRPAALSDFRKFYRKINHTDPTFKDGLPKSYTYRFEIECNYNVAKFAGRKKVILATTSFMGGKNHFMGIAYVVVGVLSILIGSIFIIVHKKYGIPSKELMNIDKKTKYKHTSSD